MITYTIVGEFSVSISTVAVWTWDWIFMAHCLSIHALRQLNAYTKDHPWYREFYLPQYIHRHHSILHAYYADQAASCEDQSTYLSSAISYAIYYRFTQEPVLQ